MQANRTAVYIVAPQGAGKTRNAPTLAAMFGCDRIVDDWDGISPVPDGALVLTNADVVARPGEHPRAGVQPSQPWPRA